MKNIKNRYDDLFDDGNIKEKRHKPKLNGDFESAEELPQRKKHTSSNHRKGKNSTIRKNTRRRVRHKIND